jgi:hypothetical protein
MKKILKMPQISIKKEGRGLFPKTNKKTLKKGLKMALVVAPGRIELPTQGFSVLCSTD